jgi:hypothetical protein
MTPGEFHNLKDPKAKISPVLSSDSHLKKFTPSGSPTGFSISQESPNSSQIRNISQIPSFSPRSISIDRTIGKIFQAQLYSSFDYDEIFDPSVRRDHCCLEDISGAPARWQTLPIDSSSTA